MSNRIRTILCASFLLIACDHEITPGQLAEGPKPVDPNAFITGTVDVAPGLEVKGSGTLFIIVRSADKPFGPPLAVKNFSDPVLPVDFQMSQQNVMIPSNHFEGNLTITARFDKDGNPLSVNPGDISADMQKIPVGTRNIKIVLNKVAE
jgi:hypothetical protein